MKTGAASQINVSEDVVRQALDDYEQERISLGRLAELLGTDYQTAIEFILSRGVQPRFAPQSVEEALRDARVAQELSDR